MKLPNHIIRLLEQKTGRSVTTASGAEMLRNDIESVTEVNISINTVKRLTGVLPYEGTPRPDTLNIIARYLGFTDWKLLQNYIDGNISQFNPADDTIFIDKLAAGAVIAVEWALDRRVKMKRLCGGVCEVLIAENSKLKVGDILRISAVAPGFPFLASAVVRGGQNLGTYSAAEDYGVTRAFVTD